MKPDDLLAVFPQDRLPWLFESVGSVRHKIVDDVMNPVDSQLATILKFRPVSLRRASAQAWGKYLLKTWRRIPVPAFGEMLGQYFVWEHAELVQSLYDAIGAEHENGDLSDESAAETIAGDRFVQAWDELSSSERFDPDLVALAIFVIASGGVASWRPGAASAVEEIAARRATQA